MKNLLPLFLIFLMSNGCSVGMALSGKKNPNLSVIRVGATRGEVELQLGPPIKTASLPEGHRADIYEYEIGNESSTGRAFLHGAMDVLTLGIWEIAGTPIEGTMGDEHTIQIVYDKQDKVFSINSVAPPGPDPAPPEVTPQKTAPQEVAPKKELGV